MLLSLKSIKFNEELSEETNCFSAKVYYKNKLIGYASNHGYGGETDIKLSSINEKQLFEEANAYAENLPPIKYGTLTIKSNLVNVVDDLFDKYLEEKEQKRLNKLMLTHLLIRKNGTISMFGYKNTTIANLSKLQVERLIAHAKDKVVDGEILNKNLTI